MTSKSCPECGSKNIKREDWSDDITPNAYQDVCQDCGEMI